MSGGYIKASLSQTLILSAISSNHTTKKEKKREIQRERERETWFRSSSRRGSPRASSSVAVARSGSTQMRSMKSPWPILVRTPSLYLYLCFLFSVHFCFMWLWSCMLFYAMLWCDWFDFVVLTLFRLFWVLRNRRKILEMEWIGYCVYGFISWVDLIWFDFFFKFYGKGWVEFGYIVFGLNGLQWVFS